MYLVLFYCQLQSFSLLLFSYKIIFNIILQNFCFSLLFQTETQLQSQKLTFQPNSREDHPGPEWIGFIELFFHGWSRFLMISTACVVGFAETGKSRWNQRWAVWTSGFQLQETGGKMFSSWENIAFHVKEQTRTHFVWMVCACYEVKR